MTGLVLISVAVFVLLIAGLCAVLVLRMLGPLELPESPPFPHRHAHPHRAHHPSAGAADPAAPSPREEVVEKN